LLAKHGRSDELDLIFKSYSNLLRTLGDWEETFYTTNRI
jgi:PKHD-type hydroxylase